MSSFIAKIKIEARPLFKELWPKTNTTIFDPDQQRYHCLFHIIYRQTDMFLRFLYKLSEQELWTRTNTKTFGPDQQRLATFPSGGRHPGLTPDEEGSTTTRGLHYHKGGQLPNSRRNRTGPNRADRSRCKHSTLPSSPYTTLTQGCQQNLQISDKTRSSWLNCALRDDEAVYWVSIGHYEAVAVGN